MADNMWHCPKCSATPIDIFPEPFWEPADTALGKPSRRDLEFGDTKASAVETVPAGMPAHTSEEAQGRKAGPFVMRSVVRHPGEVTMDDESGLTQFLTCDVELNFKGPTMEGNNKRAAHALRKLANRIEKDGFDEDGFHPINEDDGTFLGQVYIDYSEGTEF
jgi:hypothetical protein